jgi:hypothetical protein
MLTGERTQYYPRVGQRQGNGYTILLRTRNIADNNCNDNQHTLHDQYPFFPQKSCLLWDVGKSRSIPFFSKNRAFYETCGKIMNSRTDHRWQHGASALLDNWGYKHTLRICNTYCIYTATMGARTRLNVTFYVHCLFEIHMSVHRNIIPNYSQTDATFLEFVSTDAVCVSGGSSAHHQEHIIVHTASGIVSQYCC